MTARRPHRNGPPAEVVDDSLDPGTSPQPDGTGPSLPGWPPRDGYLASSWEPGPTGPARRIYTLTDAGRTWLDASASMLDAYRQTIDRFFGLYSEAFGSRPKEGRTPGAGKE